MMIHCAIVIGADVSNVMITVLTLTGITMIRGIQHDVSDRVYLLANSTGDISITKDVVTVNLQYWYGRPRAG